MSPGPDGDHIVLQITGLVLGELQLPVFSMLCMLTNDSLGHWANDEMLLSLCSPPHTPTQCGRAGLYGNQPTAGS